MAEPQLIGFPKDFDYRGVEKFKGINTKARRPSIDDEEFNWIENIFPIGDGNARAMPDRGTTFYTAPVGRTIVYANTYAIGSTDYHFICLDNGAAVQVTQSNGAVTTIAAAGTFYNGGDLPHITQYGDSGILIVTTVSANGYYAWDGSTLTSPGQSAPGWLSGLASPVILTGTTNSTTTISGFASTVGVVVGMLVTAADIPANTFVTGGTSTTVTISQAATGSNTESITFSWQMPTGINGISIDTYQQRVFIVTKTQVIMSAAGNGSYFAAANGGSITTSTDSNLRKQYTHIISANGYIYPFGDSSIFNISNVTQTVTNNVATASYQYNNSDPQTGTRWPNSVQVLGRAILFANANGVFDLLGNSATKISDALDNLFATIDTSVTPTAAVATLYGIRIWMLCIRAQDYTGTVRTMLACFDGKKWFMASQSTVPKYVYTLEVDSNLTAYGTDGTTVFPLFQTASTSTTKTMRSKLYPGQLSYIARKEAFRYYLQMDPLASTTFMAPTVTIDSESSSTPVVGSLSPQITWTNASGQTIQFQNASLDNLFWITSALINAVAAQNWGYLLGFTITTNNSDFIIERTGVGFKPAESLY